MGVNEVDVIMILLAVGSIFVGYRRGFVLQAVHLTGFFISFFIAYAYFDRLTPVVQRTIPFPDFSEYQYYDWLAQSVDVEQMFYNALAFGFLFLLVKIALTLVGHFLHQVMSLPVL